MTMQPVAAVPIDADLWWIVYLRGAFVGRPESYAQGVYFDRAVPTTRRDRMVRAAWRTAPTPSALRR